MTERDGLRTLRVLMWVLIAVDVPLYVGWLARAAYLTGQRRLPEGDLVRWALPVLLPATAVVLVLGAGAIWWVSVVGRYESPLSKRWIWSGPAFVATCSALCGTASAPDPGVPVALLSLVVTGLGMGGLFLLPAAASRRLPDVVRRRVRSAPDGQERR
ncbi:hypothetical protein OG292_02515 [Streptomyces sp. NBC_01511]|uniref:hypothetical protein n=1 Tax=unclassified Streptomyces TaxID=2593676 RepID=UPI00386A037B